ncbi:hypothetical protein UF75_2005 [Desulfosporosinus sp. I2]|nr:hypothetical protein UF75_2005 [Desulfosporosinus sp. I2]
MSQIAEDQIEIARTTVQCIYNAARKEISNWKRGLLKEKKF